MIIYENNSKGGRNEVPNEEIVEGFLKSKYAKPAYTAEWSLMRCLQAYFKNWAEVSIDYDESESDVEAILKAIKDRLWPVEDGVANA